MAAEPKTLDILEKQVLIDFWEDENDFFWHHRILLSAGSSPGKWLVATPDLEVQFVDLAEHRVVPLARAEEFPQDYRGYIYSFDADTFTGGRMEALRRQARSLLEIMGGGPSTSVTVDGASWRISDPAHASFGEEVPASVVGAGEHFVTRGKVGMVAFDPEDDEDAEWISVELVTFANLVQWKRNKWAGAGRDPRLLGDVRVGSTRELTFIDALSRGKFVKTEDLPGWPHQGERATPEFLRTMKMAGLEWMTHHNDFLQKSGVSKSSGIARAHRRVSESLALLQQWDQVDIANSACAESLVRYLLGIENAVRRNPRAPDFSLFDEIAGQGLDEIGGLQLPSYTKWISDLQRDKAQVLKQQRLWSEEASRRPQGGGGGDGGGGGGDGPPGKGGRGRGDRAGKGGRGGGRGGGGAANADP